MKTILVLLGCLILANTYSPELQKKVENGEIQLTQKIAFQVYRENYFRNGKITDEKFINFYRELTKIVEINTNSEYSWKSEINKFTFMSQEELRKLNPAGVGQNCSATVENYTKKFEQSPEFSPSDSMPTQFDWRDYHVVSPVKDQQNCGSCWTFSSTGALESHWALYTGVSPPLLSEQQLLDCASDFDNDGCQGGLPSHAFEYLKYNGGLSTEVQYPYTATELPCKWKQINTGAYAKGGSYNITYLDENELQEQLYKTGPVSIAFTVSESFYSYKGGVYNDPSCPNKPDDVNHAVLAVGYGEQEGQLYWILKNSWGEDWGENGYFRMVRGVNMCGIADCASYPVINESGDNKHPDFTYKL